LLAKTVLQISILAAILVISGCSDQTQIAEKTPEDLKMEAWVSCLKESGMKMYGQYTCSVCERQRKVIGPAFELLGEIECHPRGENPQTQLCLEKDIAKTPTWILEKDGQELDRLEGFQTLETLSESSGCSLD
jgi:hypothetical protein